MSATIKPVDQEKISAMKTLKRRLNANYGAIAKTQCVGDVQHISNTGDITDNMHFFPPFRTADEKKLYNIDAIQKQYVIAISEFLADLVKMFDADGVKVYLQDDTHYAFKIIKADKVIHIFRNKRNSFDNK